MHDPSRAQHMQQPLPIARAPVVTSPPCLAPHWKLAVSSCPAPGVRRAASPERATSATSVSRRPRRLHRLSVRHDHPLRPRRPPLQTSACRASRPRRAPPPACRSAAVPHRPVTSPFSTSILSGIVPRSLPTPPHCGPCSTPRGGSPSPAPAAFAGMTRLRASSGRTTRRRCAPRASTVPAFRAEDF
ncbi:hypothetical protein B0H14DRAFT_1030047 [Mycena olivaceomarginata]|nr:hypothetical protein B0H14DRAFT_1030047 [Mycena olivaceomarginata]